MKRARVFCGIAGFLRGCLWFLLASLVVSGWIWLLRWLRWACPVAFWWVELTLIAIGPGLWWAWCELKEEWDREKKAE